ncbi:MAG: hypothetical protein WBG38_15905 [Nodosilinea sp.]
MQIITFLLRSSWLTVAVAVLMGGLSGAGSALMLASVNAAINAPEQNTNRLLPGFVGLATLTLVTSSGSQILLARLSQQAIYKMRLQLSRWILACPLRQLESLGANRILASLTDDIDAISNTVINIPFLCVNALRGSTPPTLDRCGGMAKPSMRAATMLTGSFSQRCFQISISSSASSAFSLKT